MAVLATALLLASVALWLDRPDPAPALGHADYLYDFESLDQMVATAAAVVEATAVSVEPGPVLGGAHTDEGEAGGGPASDGAVEYVTVKLDVDEVFLGQLKGDGRSVDILELPTQELPVTPEGSHGFFFLYFDDHYGVYTLIGPEGRFLASESGTVSSTSPPDGWITALERESVKDFRASLVEAVSNVEQGKAEPAPGLVGGR